MLEKKHLVFLAGATAPFAPPLCTALVIILVIKQIGLRQVVVWFCQSLVWSQTELDSTQSCYHYKKLIDNVPGKITVLRNFKNNYAEICLAYFFVEYYGFPETIFFSESLIFALSNEV